MNTQEEIYTRRKSDVEAILQHHSQTEIVNSKELQTRLTRDLVVLSECKIHRKSLDLFEFVHRFIAKRLTAEYICDTACKWK